MNLLVVGASHRTADMALLEQLTVPAAGLPGMLSGLLRRDNVTEAVVLSTCNRVEVYAGVTTFHGGVADLSAALGERAGLQPGSLASHLYVHWDADAVTHALRVAAGLDSMVTGEAQILGQVREAYGAASAAETTGKLLHELMQQALRVGKRAHAETGIDATGRNIITAALAAAATSTGPVAGRPVLVVGAGAMGALALSALSRVDAGPRLLANRDGARALRLAASYDARPVGMDRLAEAMSTVDLVVSVTASARPVLTASTVEAALSGRPADRGPLVICDLAVPRDVEPAVAALPGVVLLDLEGLATTVPEAATSEVMAAERIVAAEAHALSSALRDTEIAPTVAALRARADEVVAGELDRLAHRSPDLTDAQRAEVAHAIHRIVQQLLHQPTVRVRQLASAPGGESYAAILADLFDLQLPQPRRADELPTLERGTA